MNLIPDIQPAADPADLVAARNQLAHLNSALERRIEEHHARYAEFWGDPLATPDAILAAMGERALIWLQCAGESIDHIKRLAAIVGRPLEDFMPDSSWQPRRGFVVSGGILTLEPPSVGHDAWGNPPPPAPSDLSPMP